MGAGICLPTTGQSELPLSWLQSRLRNGHKTHVGPRVNPGTFTQAIGNEMQSAGLLREDSVCLERLGASCYHVGRASLSEFRERERDSVLRRLSSLYPAATKALFCDRANAFHPFIFLSHERLGFLYRQPKELWLIHRPQQDTIGPQKIPQNYTEARPKILSVSMRQIAPEGL